MMPRMEKEDILHLATLSRIQISDAEAESFRGEVASVLEYVSAVESITADSGITKKTGPVFNVFRADEVKNKPDEYTEALLAEAPKRKGRHLQVKKILQMD
jgi:aspartyl-tRNA(Asn)/glutamyl-tRNA(Gln) amidotransferase subunit C